jgi:hypothetical protein
VEYELLQRHRPPSGAGRPGSPALQRGLGEYYSEGDTGAPTWLIVGDTGRTAELVGPDRRAADAGTADPDVAARWPDEGIAPNRQPGRGFATGSVRGFDLTIAASI